MKKRLITTISVLMMIIGLVGINTNDINAEDTTDYLCFTAEEANSTIKLTKTGTPADITLQTSTNKTDWSNYTFDSEITLANIGDKVYFRNTSETTTAFSGGGGSHEFVMTGKIAASGDVTTLINKNGTLDLTLAGSGCFERLFNFCTSLTKVPNLPATTLTYRCYYLMFSDCSGITSLPEDLLPAIDMAVGCYGAMFYNCENLISVPENLLPSTNLATCCYSCMFADCTSLCNLPKLPATTLAPGCYGDGFDGTYVYLYGMFTNCTSITIIPEDYLPATNLAEDCYNRMFDGCTNLTIPPELPATALAENCYYSMFSKCTNLKTIPDLPAITLADQCYDMMFHNCSNILLSDVQDGTYTIPITIPSSNSIITRGTDDFQSMFVNTGGPTSFTTTGTPVDSNSDGVITLYLKPCDVTITYDGNGSTGGSVPSSSTYTILDEATIKGNENSLIKTGKMFKGWSLRPDGKGKVYSPNDTFNIRGDMTLYARWEDPDYSFTLGSGQTYTKGALENKLFTCDGPLVNLTSVQIDNVEITENTQYTKDSGSTKITLLGTYLETLDLGSHTLKLTYSDGPTPTATFNVVNPPASEPTPNNNTFIIPNTGIQ